MTRIWTVTGILSEAGGTVEDGVQQIPEGIIVILRECLKTLKLMITVKSAE